MLAISDQEVNGAVVDCHLETVPLLLLKVSAPLVAPKQTDVLLIEPPTGEASTDNVTVPLLVVPQPLVAV